MTITTPLWADVTPEDFTNGETYELSTYEYRHDQSKNTPVRVIDLASYGDYVGTGTVGISNLDYIKRNLSDVTAIGTASYGYEAAIYRKDIPIPEKLQKILDRLEDYSFLDEDKHSEVEMEKESEAIMESFNEISSELIVPVLSKLLLGELAKDEEYNEEDENWLTAEIEDLEKQKPSGESFYKSRWDQIVDEVFANMQQDSPGEWFDSDPNSGNASINIRRIQDWLTRQPDWRIVKYFEPALTAFPSLPSEVVAPL